MSPSFFGGTAGQEAHGQGEVSAGQRVDRLFSLPSEVLAGMNIYPSEFENIKEEYNVRGYPTICYFE